MKLVSIKEVSTFLMVKPATIYSWVHGGTIPFIKLNGLLRFDMDEITKWVEGSKPVPPNIPKTLGKSANTDIDNIVKKAVESVRPRSYNPPTPASGRRGKRETSLSQGPSNGKEDNNGAL